MNLFLRQNLFQAWFYSYSLSSVSGLLEWLWSLQPKGILLPLGWNSLHEVGTFIPAQVSRTKPLCGALPEQMQPPDSFPLFLLALVPSQGHPASRKALVGLSAALEPERDHRVAIHCLLSQLTGTIWADNFVFISLNVCCRWQCPATGDISGDSLENIRKAINSLLGIISVAQIKSRVLILSTHLWAFGTSVKIWINLQLKKNIPVHT